MSHPRRALHEGETSADAGTVTRLLEEQARAFAGLPVRPVDGLGTVHHVFRVGETAVARLPRRAEWGAGLPHEATVLRRVRGRLPVAVPEVLVAGVPGAAFPHAWVLQSWLPGSIIEPDPRPAVDVARAEALAEVVAALHGVDPVGLPAAGRAPLADLDEATRAAIAETSELDRGALAAAWAAALEAPARSGPRTAIHADLLPGNLLEQDGELSAVIDWGSAGAGDPAHDLVVAWASLRSAGRSRLRALLAPDDGEWARARGIALHQALMAIPYYRRSHPRFAALNVATAREVLTDPA